MQGVSALPIVMGSCKGSILGFLRFKIFRKFGLRVWGLGFKGLGFRVKGSEFPVHGFAGVLEGL